MLLLSKSMELCWCILLHRGKPFITPFFSIETMKSLHFIFNSSLHSLESFSQKLFLRPSLHRICWAMVISFWEKHRVDKIPSFQLHQSHCFSSESDSVFIINLWFQDFNNVLKRWLKKSFYRDACMCYLSIISGIFCKFCVMQKRLSAFHVPFYLFLMALNF